MKELKKLVIKLMDLRQLFVDKIEGIKYIVNKTEDATTYTEGELTSLVSILKQIDNLLLNFNSQSHIEFQSFLMNIAKEINTIEKEKDNYSYESDKEFFEGRLRPLKIAISYLETLEKEAVDEKKPAGSVQAGKEGGKYEQVKGFRNANEHTNGDKRNAIR